MLEETAVEMKRGEGRVECCCGTLGVAGCSSSSEFHWEWLLLGESPRSTSLPQPTLATPVGSSVALGAGVSLRWLAPWVSPKLSVAGQSCRGAGLVCSVHCQCLPASPVSSDMAAGVGDTRPLASPLR